MEEKLRLGGMALQNGVLVHGPTSWGCAVRLPDGTLKVAAARKRVIGNQVTNPLLRGPARLLEAVAVLPSVKRKLPEARLPFEQTRALVSMALATVAVRLVRGSRLGAAAQELTAGLLALAPALISLRSSELAEYHGAEHISIGTYEHGEPRAKEHERCGSHLVGPLIVTTAAANVLASQAPARFRGPVRLAASLGALAASTELFGWMVRNPDRALSRALAKPGHELQHRIATAEPSHEQVEVAEAALRACLDLESSSPANEPMRA
jgi:Predicted metal-dependent enzyme